VAAKVFIVVIINILFLFPVALCAFFSYIGSHAVFVGAA